MSKSIFDEMFGDMPDELKEMLGISPTEFNREEKGEEFDYDNPPMTSKDIPDSVVTPEMMKKLVQVRKLIIEIKEMLMNDKTVNTTATKLANSSPYAQAQWLFFNDDLKDVLVKVNTLLHIHDEDMGIKKTIDEEAHKNGMMASQFVHRLIAETTIKKILGLDD